MVAVRIHEESLTSTFNKGSNPLCIIDELVALWRAARLAEVAGVIPNRDAFNESIATLAARAMTYGQRGRAMPGLTEADFEGLLPVHVKDSKDEQDIRARVYMAIGDEEFWHDQYKKAAQAYWRALRVRPSWFRAWAKYLLLRTGGFGIFTRRFILSLRELPAGTK